MSGKTSYPLSLDFPPVCIFGPFVHSFDRLSFPNFVVKTHHWTWCNGVTQLLVGLNFDDKTLLIIIIDSVVIFASSAAHKKAQLIFELICCFECLHHSNSFDSDRSVSEEFWSNPFVFRLFKKLCETLKKNKWNNFLKNRNEHYSNRSSSCGKTNWEKWNKIILLSFD